MKFPLKYISNPQKNSRLRYYLRVSIENIYPFISLIHSGAHLKKF